MTGSFWHNVLPFRRPSSTSSTSSGSIDSSSSTSLNLSIPSGHRLSRKRRELFGDFEYSFENGSMNANMQEPLGVERNSSGKDTGFPEPLSHDRNTTLPHPEADTSPYATLESSEFDLYRSHSRLSIRRRHSKPKGSHLNVPIYEDVGDTDGSQEHGGMKTIDNDVEKRGDLADPPKTVEEYVVEMGRDDQGYRPGERKKSVLRKLTLHKG
ncbi:hypothetical protein DSL72_006747 [Monilinia vaccinii-corymbosi]|uniref:Uncharacterized protein n=1 Tax=Monilinia vaccinii-corymbosi TaxID=61207 RepID=A0A8A3PPN1_9HELO|nr:hypothetical protein DSL72_006747 [Monilinia vaccinii-corymbosi]